MLERRSDQHPPAINTIRVKSVHRMRDPHVGVSIKSLNKFLALVVEVTFNLESMIAIALILNRLLTSEFLLHNFGRKISDMSYFPRVREAP